MDYYRFCKYALIPQVDSGNATGTLLAWNIWNKDGNGDWVPSTLMNVSTTSATDFQSYTQADIVRFEELYNGDTYSKADKIAPTALRCSLKWCAQYHGASRVYDGRLLDPAQFSATLVKRNPNNSDLYVPDSTELTPAQS